MFGVDLNSLPSQFDNAVQGRTLILDGDGPCYVVAATVKRMDTAIRHYQQRVLEAMFLAGATDCRIHLTARDSDKNGRGRVKAVKPYQGQRKGKSKPALLEPLREAMADNANWLPEMRVFLHRELEADDGMMQDAYVLRENGVIRSDDKDLRMTPYLYYEQDRGEVKGCQPEGFVTAKITDSGTFKCLGQGPMFFWAQMLMGDSADNVKGILKYDGKLCGPALAYELLKDVSTVNDAANLVIDGYRKINQNVIAEGWLMWLLRSRDDNVYKYMKSLALSPENLDFVEDCVRRDWCTPKEENNE